MGPSQSASGVIGGDVHLTTGLASLLVQPGWGFNLEVLAKRLAKAGFDLTCDGPCPVLV